MQLVPGLFAEGEAHHASLPWIPSLGVALAVRLDGLSLVFLGLICGIGALIFVYASEYLRSHSSWPTTCCCCSCAGSSRA